MVRCPTRSSHDSTPSQKAPHLWRAVALEHTEPEELRRRSQGHSLPRDKSIPSTSPDPRISCRAQIRSPKTINSLHRSDKSHDVRDTGRIHPMGGFLEWSPGTLINTNFSGGDCRQLSHVSFLVSACKSMTDSNRQHFALGEKLISLRQMGTRWLILFDAWKYLLGAFDGRFFLALTREIAEKEAFIRLMMLQVQGTYHLPRAVELRTSTVS